MSHEPEDPRTAPFTGSRPDDGGLDGHDARPPDDRAEAPGWLRHVPDEEFTRILRSLVRPRDD